MELDFLKDLNFRKIKNIEELKTSRGTVAFDQRKGTSKITTPDLRYFWDGERFGLHMSNSSIDLFTDFFSNLKKSNLNDKLEILYIANSLITKFIATEISFEALKFCYLSENSDLIEVALYHANNLVEFNASFNSKLIIVDLTGGFKFFKKVDVSFSNISTFKLQKASNLEYLNIQSNKIGELDISSLLNLKYLFARGNPIINILWPKKLGNISIIEIEYNNILNEALKDIFIKTDDDLKIALNDYLIQINKNGGEKSLIRAKLILLGNTTAGKSTLRRILLSEEGLEEVAAKEINETEATRENSTHGVKVFNQKFKINDLEIWVQGFDFGGQDYYHATHLPFISHNALNVLVYGFNDEKSGFKVDGANRFGLKEVEGREEIIYPINYWIGSLKKNKILELENQEQIGVFLDNLTHEGVKYNLDGLKILNIERKPQIYLGESELELVQNIRNPFHIQKLNELEIEQTSGVSVGEFAKYNFFEEAKKVKEWLLGKIFSHGTTRPILYTDIKLIEWLEKQEEVVFSIGEIYLKYNQNEIYSNESALESALKRIHSHNFGYFFEAKKFIKSPFFINKLEVFSDWIHKFILSKKLFQNLNGYFEIQDLELDVSVEPHFNRIISYLEDKSIIFKLKDIDIDKWVAPSYLPNIKSKTEELLIESFDSVDCIFEFKGFFHSNIILMLIDEFKENLILDVVKKEYLLWKNKVIIHQKSGKNNKAYLLLQLKYPGDKDFQGLYPQLSISRNVSGFVNDSNFQKVFKYVHDKLLEFKPEISIKTRYDDYIPFDAVISTLSEGKDKKSPFVYSNGVLYPKYDFRLYSGDSFDAPLKIFIAYSKFDDVYRLELRDHLTPGINEGKFIVFDDREMDLGEKWRARLKKELEQCDIFILLISIKTLGTAYVMNTEIPAIIKRFEEDNNCVKIIPIMVSPCDWSKTGLSEYNANDKAQPITLIELYGELGENERANKWQEIVKELENKIPFKSNESTTPNSPTPPNEHPAGHHQTDGGEQ